MTLGRVPGPHHRGPGRLQPGPPALLSRLACPQHCLSDSPVLARTARCTFLGGSLPTLPAPSPGALGPGWATREPPLGLPSESGWC